MAISHTNDPSAPDRSKESGLNEQKQLLEEQLLISTEQMKLSKSNYTFRNRISLFLKMNLHRQESFLAQFSEDKQALMEKVDGASLGLHQLMHDYTKTTYKSENIHKQLEREQSQQQALNTELEENNRVLYTKGDRLALEEQSLRERNGGLEADIIMLEEIAVTLEHHAQELQATAQLLRERNRLLRQHNSNIRSDTDMPPDSIN